MQAPPIPPEHSAEHPPIRLVIRADGGPRIGGGHVMRCLTLADAARKTGGSAHFVTLGGAGSMAPRIREAGFTVTEITPGLAPVDAEQPGAPPSPPHGDWLGQTWQKDAEVTALVCAEEAPDWLVVDHYGLDARWAEAIRSHHAGLRIMALDDLDDRPLGTDLLLDQTRLEGRQRNAPPCSLTGPDYTLLRDEFAALRPQALARRAAQRDAQHAGPRRVIIMPGMMDAAHLAPLALEALREFPALEAEVIMGRASQSAEAVSQLCAGNPQWQFTPEPPDMAARMAAADLCIGAAGMTGWERCALGLPTLAVAVADNQRPSLAGLEAAGAVIALSLDAARAGALAPALTRALTEAPQMSRAAASLCDGLGAARVLSALSGQLRPIAQSDAERLFHWRGQAHIRAASLDTGALDWGAHLDWLSRILIRRDGLWMIYAEAGHPLGHVNARQVQGDTWHWGFYIGEQNAPKGAGCRMLSAFLRLLRQHGVRRLTAEVRAGNAASIHLHCKLGFEQLADRDGLLAFELPLGDVG